jgi:hypothetical protein
MGNVGVESALMVPEFAELVRYFFTDFFHAIKTIYLDKYPEENSQMSWQSAVWRSWRVVLCFHEFLMINSHLKNTTKRILNRLDKGNVSRRVEMERLSRPTVRFIR